MLRNTSLSRWPIVSARAVLIMILRGTTKKVSALSTGWAQAVEDYVRERELVGDAYTQFTLVESGTALQRAFIVANEKAGPGISTFGHFGRSYL